MSQELKDLSESFKEKVAKGEARWANSGYQGKGYSYDSSEISDAQKLAQMEKRQALIEAGLLDPDEEEAKGQDQDDNVDSGEAGAKGRPAASGIRKKDAVGMLANVSADVLTIPGMRLHGKLGADMTTEEGYAIARGLETTQHELMRTIFPHPTLSEAMKEAALAVDKRAIHK